MKLDSSGSRHKSSYTSKNTKRCAAPFASTPLYEAKLVPEQQFRTDEEQGWFLSFAPDENSRELPSSILPHGEDKSSSQCDQPSTSSSGIANGNSDESGFASNGERMCLSCREAPVAVPENDEFEAYNFCSLSCEDGYRKGQSYLADKSGLEKSDKMGDGVIDSQPSTQSRSDNKSVIPVSSVEHSNDWIKRQLDFQRLRDAHVVDIEPRKKKNAGRGLSDEKNCSQPKELTTTVEQVIDDDDEEPTAGVSSHNIVHQNNNVIHYNYEQKELEDGQLLSDDEDMPVLEPEEPLDSIMSMCDFIPTTSRKQEHCPPQHSKNIHPSLKPTNVEKSNAMSVRAALLPRQVSVACDPVPTQKVAPLNYSAVPEDPRLKRLKPTVEKALKNVDLKNTEESVLKSPLEHDTLMEVERQKYGKSIAANKSKRLKTCQPAEIVSLTDDINQENTHKYLTSNQMNPSKRIKRDTANDSNKHATSSVPKLILKTHSNAQSSENLTPISDSESKAEPIITSEEALKRKLKRASFEELLAGGDGQPKSKMSSYKIPLKSKAIIPPKTFQVNPNSKESSVQKLISIPIARQVQPVGSQVKPKTSKFLPTSKVDDDEEELPPCKHCKTNPSIVNEQWEKEYCSTKCAVLYTKAAFAAFVKDVLSKRRKQDQLEQEGT